MPIVEFIRDHTGLVFFFFWFVVDIKDRCIHISSFDFLLLMLMYCGIAMRRLCFCSVLKICMILCRIRKERERSPVLAIKIGDGLPENVIVEILSWLPVKDLLQLKCVCKSWCAIISSNDFISKHLKNYYEHKSDDNDCLLVQYYISHAELQLFELLLDDTPRVLANEVLYSMPLYGSHVCGPCDGIYYLYNYDEAGRALWNPAINELKVLPRLITKPHLPPGLGSAANEVYGFGYDPATDDYKVVVLKGYWPASDEEESEVTPPLSVFIYSLRMDSWRYWGDLAQYYDLEDNKCYIAVNGCFYWLGSCERDENPEVIICFDMVKDATQEMHVPDYDQPASKSLGIYDDSLAFLAVHENENRLDIWTWKEGLWAKKFTMGLILDVGRPIGHWKKNKILLEGDCNQLVLCDPNIEEIKRLEFQMDHWCEGALVYRESLLSVKDRSRWGHLEAAEADTNQV